MLKGSITITKSGEVFYLTRKFVFDVGRSIGCDICLSDPRVAMCHCRIYRHEDKYILYDLGTQEGTYVNSKPVSQGVLLKDGDLIRVGPYTLQFRLVHVQEEVIRDEDVEGFQLFPVEKKVQPVTSSLQELQEPSGLTELYENIKNTLKKLTAFGGIQAVCFASISGKTVFTESSSPQYESYRYLFNLGKEISVRSRNIVEANQLGKFSSVIIEGTKGDIYIYFHPQQEYFLSALTEKNIRLGLIRMVMLQDFQQLISFISEISVM